MPVIPQASRRTYIVDSHQNVVFVAEDDDAANLTGVVEAIQALPQG